MIKHINKKAGFSLIELLVTVAIVSIISSIVFANLQSVKIKAENTAIIKAVVEYEKAINLYLTDSGGIFPNDFSVSLPAFDESHGCLGFDSGPCAGAFAEGSEDFNDQLDPYFNGNTPATMMRDSSMAGVIYRDKETVESWSGLFPGSEYGCPVGEDCNYDLSYFLRGKDVNCGPGEEQEFISSNYTNHTFCRVLK